MAEKRFRTRKQWHNTILVLWALPVLLLVGVLIAVSTGNYWPLIIFGGAWLVIVSVAMFRDSSLRCTYSIFGGDLLVIVSGSDRHEVRAEEIIDASLVDRAGAREYVRIRSQRLGEDKAAQRAMQRGFLRFCTVDIGLRTFTFGLGRGVIDRMPNARHDMVLLRLRNGKDVLLSPEYNQEMVDYLVRMLRRQEEAKQSRSDQ